MISEFKANLVYKMSSRTTERHLLLTSGLHMCVCVCVCVCIHKCILGIIRTQVYPYTKTRYVCIYVCMYVCMKLYLYI
jgi:hypothetical protein